MKKAFFTRKTGLKSTWLQSASILSNGNELGKFWQIWQIVNLPIALPRIPGLPMARPGRSVASAPHLSRIRSIQRARINPERKGGYLNEG